MDSLHSISSKSAILGNQLHNHINKIVNNRHSFTEIIKTKSNYKITPLNEFLYPNEDQAIFPYLQGTTLKDYFCH